MRFSLRRQPVPQWVDDLAWTPERPFGFDPGNDAPRAGTPSAEVLPPEWRTGPGFKRLRDPAPVDDAAPLPQPLPAPANSNAPRSLLIQRLAIGLAQGAGLLLLIQLRAQGAWPGSDPYLFAALALAGLFAPLVWLEGLGEIPAPPLLAWTAAVALILASLGLYHHWRIQGPDQGHVGLRLALTVALMLVIAQSFLKAAMQGRKTFADYTILSAAAWTLAARLTLWAGITALAWIVAGSGTSLFSWLGAHHPQWRPSFDASLLVPPLVGLASALGFHWTRAGTWTTRLVRKIMLACALVALPMLMLTAAVTLALHVLVAPVTLAWLLTLSVLTLIAINASYRSGEARSRWRKGAEPCATILLIALVGLAWSLLETRVTALGWTAGRIQAAVALAVLSLYGAGYLSSALIGIGGGRWMQRIEGVNIVLALAILFTALALSSPLADPLRLAVESQQARLAGGTDPALFDFAWLRQGGVRFGAGALAAMTQSPSPETARDAAIALAAAPHNDAPPPSQIGANITVRTPGARMPNALLAQDWSAAPQDVPPCLTKAALACDAWFLDLDGDGVREILMVYGTDMRWWASVLKLRDGRWVAAASLASPNCRGTLSAMKSGRFSLADPLPGWRDVLIAGLRLKAAPAPVAALPCPVLTSTNGR